MNTKGIKFLAVLAVLALAFSVFAVTTNSDDSDSVLPPVTVLPDPVGGVITLAEDTTYVITDCAIGDAVRIDLNGQDLILLDSVSISADVTITDSSELPGTLYIGEDGNGDVAITNTGLISVNTITVVCDPVQLAITTFDADGNIGAIEMDSLTIYDGQSDVALVDTVGEPCILLSEGAEIDLTQIDEYYAVATIVGNASIESDLYVPALSLAVDGVLTLNADLVLDAIIGDGDGVYATLNVLKTSTLDITENGSLEMATIYNDVMIDGTLVLDGSLVGNGFVFIQGGEVQYNSGDEVVVIVGDEGIVQNAAVIMSVNEMMGVDYLISGEAIVINGDAGTFKTNDALYISFENDAATVSNFVIPEGGLTLGSGAEITIPAGCTISGTIIGPDDSIATLNLKAGDNGVTITGGSIIIDGDIVASDDVVDGVAVTFENGEVYLSGTVADGTVIEITGDTVAYIGEDGLQLGDGATIIVGEETGDLTATLVTNGVDDAGELDLGQSGALVIESTGELHADDAIIVTDVDSQISTKSGSLVDASHGFAIGDPTAEPVTVYPTYEDGTTVYKSVGSRYQAFVIGHAITTAGQVQFGVAVNNLYYKGYNQAGPITNLSVTSFDNDFVATSGTPAGYMYSYDVEDFDIAWALRVWEDGNRSEDARVEAFGTCIDAGTYNLHVSFTMTDGVSTTTYVEADVANGIKIMPIESYNVTLEEYDGETVAGVPVDDLISNIEIDNDLDRYDRAFSAEVKYYTADELAVLDLPVVLQSGYYVLFNFNIYDNITRTAIDWDEATFVFDIEDDDYYFADGFFIYYLGEAPNELPRGFTVTVDYDNRTDGVNNYLPTEYTVLLDLVPTFNIEVGILTDDTVDLFGLVASDFVTEEDDTYLVNWVYDYVGFSSAANEQRGYYVPYYVSLPAGIEWEDVSVTAFGNEYAQGVFDGFCILRTNHVGAEGEDNTVTVTMMINNQEVTATAELDMTVLEYVPYVEYVPVLEDLPVANTVAGVTMDDFSDRMVVVIYNPFSLEVLPGVGEFYMPDNTTGEPDYTENLVAEHGFGVWYFSFDDQLADIPFVPGVANVIITDDNGNELTGEVLLDGLVITDVEIDQIEGTVTTDYEQKGFEGQQMKAELYYQADAGAQAELIATIEDLDDEDGEYTVTFDDVNIIAGIYTVSILADDVEQDRMSEAVTDGNDSVLSFVPTDEGTDLLGKVSSDLQEAIEVGDFNIVNHEATVVSTGKVYFVTDYTGFWGSEDAVEPGFYLALDISKANNDDFITDDGYLNLIGMKTVTVKGTAMEDSYVLYLGPVMPFTTFTIEVDFDGATGFDYTETTYTLDMSQLSLNEYIIVLEDEFNDTVYMRAFEGQPVQLPNGRGDDSHIFLGWMIQPQDYPAADNDYDYVSDLVVKKEYDQNGDNYIYLDALYQKVTVPVYDVYFVNNYTDEITQYGPVVAGTAITLPAADWYAIFDDYEFRFAYWAMGSEYGTPIYSQYIVNIIDAEIDVTDDDGFPLHGVIYLYASYKLIDGYKPVVFHDRLNGELYNVWDWNNTNEFYQIHRGLDTTATFLYWVTEDGKKFSASSQINLVDDAGLDCLTLIDYDGLEHEDGADGIVELNAVYGYTIKWFDFDGRLIAEENIITGGDLVPPAGWSDDEVDEMLADDPEHSWGGWMAAGWNVPVKGADLGVAEQSIELYATYDVPVYHVIFYMDDGVTIIEEGDYAYGTTPIVNDPEKIDPTGQFVYAFIGWEPELVEVTEDAEYVAMFEENVATYTITWKNYDDSLLTTTEVPYGEVPVYDGQTPVKPADPQSAFVWNFIGWNTDIDATVAIEPLPEVVGDATYYAIFNEDFELSTDLMILVFFGTQDVHYSINAQDGLAVPKGDMQVNYSYMIETQDAGWITLTDALPAEALDYNDGTPESTYGQTVQVGAIGADIQQSNVVMLWLEFYGVNGTNATSNSVLPQ